MSLLWLFVASAIFGAGVTLLSRRAKPRRAPLSDISEARSYPSWVAGITYDDDGFDRGAYCIRLRPGDIVDLVAEPGNPHDPNAVAVHHHRRRIGYIPRKHGWVCKSIREGDRLQAVVRIVEPRDEDDRRAGLVGLTITVLSDGNRR